MTHLVVHEKLKDEKGLALVTDPNPSNSLSSGSGVGPQFEAVDLSTLSAAKADLKARAEEVEHHALIVDADGAVAFLEQHPGWYIFPGRIERDGARWMKLPAKGLGWTSHASNDPEVVRHLWNTYPEPVAALGRARVACVAVHVGKSGLVVLDQDADIDKLTSDAAAEWRTALASPECETLTLKSCTRGMPHYVFRQRDGQVVEIQDWVAGEVKAQNGYIFISNHEPAVDAEIKVIPDVLTKMLRVTSSVAVLDGMDAPSDEYLAVTKLDDRDLEVWLSTTECRLEPSQEHGLVQELIEHLVNEAESGHRRDAMRKACLTLAIEASAGIYGAQTAWDALEEAYRELRDDPSRNNGVRGKEWSTKWWHDARTMLAGAVEKVEAGRYDDAINEKRERFGIMSDSEEESLRDWMEVIASETFSSPAAPAPTPAPTPSRDHQPLTIAEALETASTQPALPENAPEGPSEGPTPDVSPDENPNLLPAAPTPDEPSKGLSLDPNEELRRTAADRGVDLDTVLQAVQATIASKAAKAAADPVPEALRLAKKVHETLERDLVKQIVKSVVTHDIEPVDYSWLSIDALLERAPGTMLLRTDGEGLINDRGCVHLIGDKSTGKSWLCAKLAVEQMKLGKLVVWLDYETDEQLAAERLLQAGATIEQIQTKMRYFAMKGESIHAAVEAINKMEDVPACMIVDSVDASMASSGSEDENSSSGYHAWRAAIAPLTEVMVTVLIEHTGHDNAHRARGASAKGQQADQEFSAKVVKPFSKAESGLVEWTCRKHRRGGSFTTDDVAAYLIIEPNGNVVLDGKVTALEAAVKMQLVPPTDSRVIGFSLAGAAAAMSDIDKKIFDWMRAQGSAWPLSACVSAVNAFASRADVSRLIEHLLVVEKVRTVPDKDGGGNVRYVVIK